MIRNLNIDDIITVVAAKYILELESIKGYKELDDALSSRWKFEKIVTLCKKWIEEENKISQIEFLLQKPCYDKSKENLIDDYSNVVNLIENIIMKKIKTIKVDIKLKNLESDFV